MRAIKELIGVVIVILLILGISVGVVWGIVAMTDKTTVLRCETLAQTSSQRTKVTGGECYIEVCKDVWIKESDVSSRLIQINELCGNK